MVTPSIRLASAKQDRLAIYVALCKLVEYAKVYEWVYTYDIHKAALHLMDFVAAGKAYVIDGFLVMTDVSQPWYSNDNLLQEWLVLKLYQGGSIDSIPPALLDIAKEQGCKAVIGADSSPINLVGRAYEAAGFTPLTRSFFKKV